MSRQIITNSRAQKPSISASPKADAETDKILKMIPGEAVVAYLAGFNIITTLSDNPNSTTLQWIFFAVMFVALFIYTRKVGVESNVQLTLTLVSFVIWVLSIGGPVGGTTVGGFSTQILAAIFLPVYTFLTPKLFTAVEP